MTFLFGLALGTFVAKNIIMLTVCVGGACYVTYKVCNFVNNF